MSGLLSAVVDARGKGLFRSAGKSPPGKRATRPFGAGPPVDFPAGTAKIARETDNQKRRAEWLPRAYLRHLGEHCVRTGAAPGPNGLLRVGSGEVGSPWPGSRGSSTICASCLSRSRQALSCACLARRSFRRVSCSKGTAQLDAVIGEGPSPAAGFQAVRPQRGDQDRGGYARCSEWVPRGFSGLRFAL